MYAQIGERERAVIRRSFTAERTHTCRTRRDARAHQPAAGFVVFTRVCARARTMREDEKGSEKNEKEKEIKMSREPNEEKARGGTGPLIRRSAAAVAAAGIPCTT